VCVGVLALLVFQIFENIGMTMGIMPVTGIPLPFMSYGGSSTVTAFACVGVVTSVSLRRFR
jgi:rod shape determining protein RodA